jgi:N-methylhydantoinase A/oxoprolinase/acetone carboxylase beta subunit
VFSAFGISFSDIGKTYEVVLENASTDAAAVAFDDMFARAERDMFQEGYGLDECAIDALLVIESELGEPVETRPYRPGDDVEVRAGLVSLRLECTAALPQPTLTLDAEITPRPAVAHGTREVRSSARHVDECSVYVLDDQQPGAGAAGPAIVEGPFFTARVPSGWRFDVTSNSDLILTDAS